jgi:hypothetical protein
MSVWMGSASAATPQLIPKKCGTFTGAPWSVPAFGKKGTQWQWSAAKTPCSFAKTWALKFEKMPYKGEAVEKLVGPKGWTCRVSDAGTTGTAGSCYLYPSPTSNPTKVFGWGPANQG